jgi:hypothetical protein
MLAGDQRCIERLGTLDDCGAEAKLLQQQVGESQAHRIVVRHELDPGHLSAGQEGSRRGDGYQAADGERGSSGEARAECKFH